MTIQFAKIKEYGWYLFIFVLLWQTRLIIRNTYANGAVWEYGRISLYGWDIVMAILVVLSFPAIWQFLKNQKSKIKNQNDWSKLKILKQPFFVWVLILGYALTLVTWSNDRTLALSWFLRLLEGVAVWLLVRAIKPKLSTTLWSLVVAGTLQALWGIWQFLLQSTFANKWLGVAVHHLWQPGTSVVLTSTGRWLRAYGGQAHPNVLGGLLVITILATAWLYLQGNLKIKNQKSKLLNISFLLFVIQLIGLFFTFSRGAWLALFVALGWWAYKLICHPERSEGSLDSSPPKADQNDKIIFRLCVITLSIFFILALLYPEPTFGRLLGGSRLEQQSVNERVGSIADSLVILKNNWWQGVGLGNYTVALQKFHPNLPAYAYQPVHNIFLLMLTEWGVIGLLLLACLFYFFIKKIPVTRNQWLVAIIITGLFDHYWLTVPSMFMLCWLVISIGPLTNDS